MATAKKMITIEPPNIQTAVFHLRGTAPYVQGKFGETAKKDMRGKQLEGSTAKKGKKRKPKDFEQLYKESQHISTKGWHGIPANGFRAALVSACRICGFQMTKAKLSVFIEPDGFDKDDGTPLVKITKGKPVYHESYVKNETGVADLRPRAMFNPGWEATLKIKFDADMFTQTDIANLLMRVGMQVGIGAGRADSPKSCGMGWGFFEII